MKTIRIRGTYGSFEVCPNTGQITTPYTQIPKPYRVYSFADVQGFRAWCERADVVQVADVPMTCVSLRRYDGKTEPACATSREEWVYSLNNPRLLAA